MRVIWAALDCRITLLHFHVRSVASLELNATNTYKYRRMKTMNINRFAAAAADMNPVPGEEVASIRKVLEPGFSQVSLFETCKTDVEGFTGFRERF